MQTKKLKFKVEKKKEVITLIPATKLSSEEGWVLQDSLRKEIYPVLSKGYPIVVWRPLEQTLDIHVDRSYDPVYVDMVVAFALGLDDLDEVIEVPWRGDLHEDPEKVHIDLARGYVDYVNRIAGKIFPRVILSGMTCSLETIRAAAQKVSGVKGLNVLPLSAGRGAYTVFWKSGVKVREDETQRDALARLMKDLLQILTQDEARV